ncbi:hypothetical protein [Treponema phagedenis]|uniref:hypothetical protein n=1 Tax=Treponema phagedenis TaxID=162 RepID=UPI003EBF1D93
MNAKSKKSSVTKQIENPYVSRNQKVPDYLTKKFYLADKAQAYADKQKMFKGRPVKIARYKELMQYIESRIADDHFSPDATIGEIKVKGMQFDMMI